MASIVHDTGTSEPAHYGVGKTLVGLKTIETIIPVVGRLLYAASGDIQREISAVRERLESIPNGTHHHTAYHDAQKQFPSLHEDIEEITEFHNQ